MYVLVPIAITSAMIGSGTTIAEPAASETAWVSGGTYAIDDLRIRTTTHRVYSCVQAHTGRTTLPENDPKYWLDAGPTLRYVPFDWYRSTAASAVTTLTYVLQPGFFNAVSLYGLIGDSISLTVKDAPSGNVLLTYSGLLSEPSTGWYSYLFGKRRPISVLVFTDIPISPTAEITITVTAGTGNPVEIGMINCGDYRSIIGDVTWGGTEYGASAEPTSNSYIKDYGDGTTGIKRRPSGTNMVTSDVMPQESADYALACIQEVLDVPVSWIVENIQGYRGLNVFGLGSGRVVYDTAGTARLSLTIKGFM